MNAVVAETMPASSADQTFNLVYRRAKAMASASLVPQQYRDNIPNTMIALEMADRIGASPMQVMQNLHVIQGKPSWSSTFLIACVNACGRFSPMRFEEVGDNPKGQDYRVRAYATDKASGERCNGPWIDWEMVKAEKWLDKPGSKWKTMPGPMFLYRAAGFWSRLYAPEVSMGIHTREEVEDVWGSATVVPTAQTNHGNLRLLEGELLGKPVDTGAEEVTETPEVAEARKRLESAANMDQLDDAFDLTRGLPQDQLPELIRIYEQRRDALELDQQ